MSINRNPSTEQRWWDITKDCQGQLIYPVLSPKAWNLRRSISLLAQKITPSIRTKTKPVHNPNLCFSAFAESNKFPHQGALPIGPSGIHRRRWHPNFISIFCISGKRLTMLNLPNSNILLCVEPTDMRKSFDSLAMLVRIYLGGDPLSGSWFVFHGKKNDR